MAGWLDDPVNRILEKSLDAASLRQRVLTDNVANVDTPGFKRSDVDFQAVLQTELGDLPEVLPLKQVLAQHLSGMGKSSPTGVITDGNTTLRNDGNNVDIDQEMAKVAENGIYYNSMTQAISSQLGLLRMVISGKS